jgi:diaminopimelate epimerase
VTLPGGDLVIDWREGDDHILMTGPFALDYQGTLPPQLLLPAQGPSG